MYCDHKNYSYIGTPAVDWNAACTGARRLLRTPNLFRFFDFFFFFVSFPADLKCCIIIVNNENRYVRFEKSVQPIIARRGNSIVKYVFSRKNEITGGRIKNYSFLRNKRKKKLKNISKSTAAAIRPFLTIYTFISFLRWTR